MGRCQRLQRSSVSGGCTGGLQAARKGRCCVACRVPIWLSMVLGRLSASPMARARVTVPQ
eukprot:6795291-Prymnesium_polylepis.1